MPAIRIIANPAAGGNSAYKSIPLINELIQKYELDAEVIQTTQRGHAIQLARQAVEDGCSIVVAAGGDGTLNEVINGLIQARGDEYRTDQSAATADFPALGVIAIGRGNDFAQGVGVPEELEACIQTLANGKRRPIDIGFVKGGRVPEGRFFGNCVGIGFDAMVTIQVMRMPRLGGFISFFLAVLKTIFVFYKGPKVQLDYNGRQESLGTLMVSIMNGQRLGGGFWLAPNSRPDDFVFDVCIVNQVNRRGILRLLPMFLKGTQGKDPAVRSVQTTHMTVTALEGSLPAHMDGEIISVEDKQLEIQLLPHQIDVIVPNEPNQQPT